MIKFAVLAFAVIASCPAVADVQKVCDLAMAQSAEHRKFVAYSESRANSMKSSLTSAALAGQDTPMFRNAATGISESVSLEARKQINNLDEHDAQIAGLCE